MELKARGKLKAALESEAVCQKQYGRDMTKKIMMRVNYMVYGSKVPTSAIRFCS